MIRSLVMLTSSQSFSSQLNSKTACSSTNVTVKAHPLTACVQRLSLHLCLFSSLLRCTCMFSFGLRNLSVPPNSSHLGLLTDLKNCPDRHFEVESQQRGGGGGGGGLLKPSEVPIISVPRRCCDSGALLWAVGGVRKSGREAHVHLLTRSICLFFLAEWVAGGLSPATAPRGKKQTVFQPPEGSSLREASWNGTICCGTADRLTVSERIQLNPASGRTFQVFKNS